jgi:hypothetical protein
MKKTALDVNCKTAFFEKTFFLMTDFEKSRGLPFLNNEEIHEYFSGAVDEICSAFQRAETADLKEIGEYKKSIFALIKERDSHSEGIPDQEYFETISNFILLCKRAGVFPYYITYVAGVALYYVFSEKRGPATDDAGFLLQGFIEDTMHLEFENEMVYLIARAYRHIGENIVEDGKMIALMKAAFEGGFLNESLYGGCSQCLVKTMLTVMKKDDEKSAYLFKAASSLSGGVAGCNDGACGAYIGANMLISSLMGRELSELEDEESRSYEASNRIGQTLHDQFVEVYGTVLCCKVHESIFGRQFNFRDDADFEAFKHAGAHGDKCPCVVGLTASILAEIFYKEDMYK